MKRALVCATLLLSADIQSAPNLSVSNLVYVKIPKTASTNTAGVVRRIAFHHRLSGFRGNNWIGKEPGACGPTIRHGRGCKTESESCACPQCLSQCCETRQSAA